MKRVLLVLLLVLSIVMLTSCRQAENVSRNISRQADAFKTYRKVTIINLISDQILMEVEGLISLQESTSTELAIIIKTGNNEYKKHFIYIGAHQITYLVEQLESSNTNPYHWEIKIYAVTPKIDVGRDND